MTYRVVNKDTGGNYISTSYAEISGTKIKTNHDNPTYPFVKELWIEAKTSGGALGYHSFYLKICGAETVQSITTGIPFYLFNEGDQGNNANLGDMRLNFTWDIAECPIGPGYITNDDWSVYSAHGDSSKDIYVGTGHNLRARTNVGPYD